MNGRTYPPDVLEQARDVLDAWSQINDELVFGDLNFNALANELKDANLAATTVVSIENRLDTARNERDLSYTSLWNKIKRLRAGIKASYGDDSFQFGLIGGTPISERKSRTRKQVSA